MQQVAHRDKGCHLASWPVRLRGGDEGEEAARLGRHMPKKPVWSRTRATSLEVRWRFCETKKSSQRRWTSASPGGRREREVARECDRPRERDGERPWPRPVVETRGGTLALGVWPWPCADEEARDASPSLSLSLSSGSSCCSRNVWRADQKAGLCRARVSQSRATGAREVVGR